MKVSYKKTEQLRLSRRETVFSKKKMAALLTFAKLNPNKSQDFWNNVIWTVETKMPQCISSCLVKTRHGRAFNTSNQMSSTVVDGW